MTREEAIAQLKMDRDLANFNPMTGEEEPMNEDCRKSAEALDMAIKALEQEPCEDTISREDAIKVLQDNCNHWETNIMLIAIAEDLLKELPSVTPTRKKGKWEKYGIPRAGEQHYQCTNCKNYVNFGMWGSYYKRDFKYCPHCGAEMDGERQ